MSSSSSNVGHVDVHDTSSGTVVLEGTVMLLVNGIVILFTSRCLPSFTGLTMVWMKMKTHQSTPVSLVAMMTSLLISFGIWMRHIGGRARDVINWKRP